MRLPGDKCEECCKPIEVGQEVTFTEDTYRFWHTACFEASLTSLSEWPRDSYEVLTKQKND
jgi:hypothetical protein